MPPPGFSFPPYRSDVDFSNEPGPVTRVLLTGSTGFIGSAIHRRLAARPGVRLRLLRRGRVGGSPGGSEVFSGDLADPGTLTAACEGVDVLVHAASYVGSDAVLCGRVNRAGTARLMDEASRSGVSAIIYVSTASVYGDGPHAGIAEDVVPLCPRSPVSASRAAAEALVRAAGGTVLRPHLVYGPGDRWVVPALARLLRLLPSWIEDGVARMSMIQVDELARLVDALARRPLPTGAGAVFHANHPAPVRICDAGGALRQRLGISLPSGTMTYRRALADPPPGVRRRHITMIGADHWYASDRLWRLTGCRPGRPFPEDLAEAALWYPDLRRGPGTSGRTDT